jgi:hypothetical protein
MPLLAKLRKICFVGVTLRVFFVVLVVTLRVFFVVLVVALNVFFVAVGVLLLSRSGLYLPT